MKRPSFESRSEISLRELFAQQASALGYRILESRAAFPDYVLEREGERQCIGTRKDGEPCRAWAMWNSLSQLCIRHSGRYRAVYERPWWDKSQVANVTPCRCAAYQWPHRPASGLCCWPDEPAYYSPMPAGTHADYRRPMSKMLRALLPPTRRRRPVNVPTARLSGNYTKIGTQDAWSKR